MYPGRAGLSVVHPRRGLQGRVQLHGPRSVVRGGSATSRSKAEKLCRASLFGGSTQAMQRREVTRVRGWYVFRATTKPVCTPAAPHRMESQRQKASQTIL